MQYCSLQHQTLLSPPGTSTTERCFHFGPAASFFLELLVIAFHSSPVAYRPGGLFLLCCIFFAFSYCSWDSPGQNTRVGCYSLLQGIFLTQGSNTGFLHCTQILYCLIHQRAPGDLKDFAIQNYHELIIFKLLKITMCGDTLNQCDIIDKRSNNFEQFLFTLIWHL